MVFGTILISVSIGTASYYFISAYPAFGGTQPIPPAICCGIISGMMGMIFLSIFSFSSDAIFMAFLLDEELRFAGNDRPQYMQEFAIEMKRRGRGGCEC